MKELSITIKGKSYPCRMTMGAFVYFKRMTGVDVSKMDFSDMEQNLQFFYCAVKAACQADDIEFEPSFEEFAVNISLADMAAFNKAGQPDDEAAVKKN